MNPSLEREAIVQQHRLRLAKELQEVVVLGALHRSRPVLPQVADRSLQAAKVQAVAGQEPKDWEWQKVD
jgi:hypothetical protein